MARVLAASLGSEWKSGLAWAIIGGLISSLLLTRIIVPIVYSKLEDFRISIPSFAKKLIRRKKNLWLLLLNLNPLE